MIYSYVRSILVDHCSRSKESIMNKIFWVAFAFLAVVSLVHCDSSSEEVLEKVKSKHLKRILKDRKETVDSGLDKLEEICPGVTSKLTDALIQFAECDEKTDESVTICQAIQSYTLNCTAPLIKVVDDCLPQKARGLPALGLKSVVSVADYLCKLNGESIFELFNPCLYEDDDDEETECEKKVLAKLDAYKNEPPSPSELCNVATDLRPCLQQEVNAACKNQKTRDVALGLYDALVHPCSSIVNQP